MRAPLSWIREFTPVAEPASVIAEALDNLGLEVEEMDAPGAEIGGVIVARIVEVLDHPNADKLRLADVDTGDGVVRVVCGAPNIEAGMTVPLATVGGTLPGGIELTRRKIRGEVSEGMLCSARELGLGDDHAGILAIDADAPLGTDVREALGLDDVVFDLKITPNRPDAMGIVGIARDLAAHFGLPFTAPAFADVDAVESLDGATAVVEAADRCPRLVVRRATVTMGESPAWMQRRLRLAGMRPISTVVDVTNYVMLERCRPLHAFDLGRLAGGGLLVRLAKAGERMTTLDGVERTLHPDDLLICDAERAPQAIAGIMGGRDSEVDDSTREILIESAYFAPSGISASAKRLGLRSEASARFERGIDPNGCASGAARAIELLEEVASAHAVVGVIDRYPTPIERPRITVRAARVNAILGTDLAPTVMHDLLRPLAIDIEPADDTFVAVAPTDRPDLEREIDIIEEVGRRFGLNNIVRTVPTSPTVGRLTRAQHERRLVADVLVGAGLCEAFTLPLVAPADLQGAGFSATELVELENPLRAEESVLRPALLPGLLAALGTNVARSNADAALFELGVVFGAPGDGALLPDERDRLGVAATGRVRERPFAPDRDLEPADAVAWLEAVADALRIADLRLVAGGGAGFDRARSARVVVDGVEAGSVGAVAADAAAYFGVPAAIGIELDLASLLGARRREPIARPVSRFQSAGVDLAFVLPESVPAAEVLATLRAAGGELLESVSVFDAFRSDAIGAGRVSLAFALRFRSPDRTLTDAEVATARQAAIDAVVGAHGAELRG
ncbi:MAG TPA: phenylalanine--tRNA ligase subunit beta [Acidimicrobiia bacterium]|nr:phenylalanine--tRNA ligase subunit beta [Acidimicrobiia bacterium]